MIDSSAVISLTLRPRSVPTGRVAAQTGRLGGAGGEACGGEEDGAAEEGGAGASGAGRGPQTPPPLEPQAATVLPDEGELPENRSVVLGQPGETLRLGLSLFYWS